jgi:hypothetical protein
MLSRHLILTLSSVAALLGASCAATPEDHSSQRAQPIINGKVCTEQITPTAVALLLEAKMNLRGTEIPMRTVMCTGTLIAPDVVLTAAHCVTPSMLSGGFGTVTGAQYHIAFTANLATYADQMRGLPPQVGGKPLAELPTEALKVREFLAHPDFDPKDLETFTGGVDTNLNDIGLMFLEKPVALETVRPAVLITKNEAETYLKKDASVRIAGWGQQLVTANPLFPPPPGTVGVKICATSFINEIGAHEMQIGGGPETSRKCHGDSGGPSYIDIETPLAVKDRLVGITSHAYDQTDCAKGGVDTRVDVWLDWIDAELKKRCQDSSRSWCEVGGIIPAEFYEPPPAPDAGASAADSGTPAAGDGESSSGDGGCSFASSRAADAAPLTSLTLLTLLLLWRRRR